MNNKNFITLIKENWIILAFIAQLITSYALTGENMKNLDVRVTALENKQEKEEVVLLQIQTDVASIKTSIKYIEQSLR